MGTDDITTQDPERRAYVDLFSTAPADIARSLELELTKVAGGVALVAPGIDSLLFNRALGVDSGRIGEVVRVFAERGVKRYMIALEPGAAPSLGAALGLERFHRPWIKLGCRPQAQSVVADGFELRSARPEDTDAIAALYCAGFDVPAAAEPLIAALIGRPRWHVYVAVATDQPGRPIMGLGISHLDRGHAYLFSGVTSPDFRRRGVQRALVAARVNHAHRCGASSVRSDTGAAIPNQPNHSQQNLERAGLQVLYARDHLVPCGTTWTNDKTNDAVRMGG